MCPLCQKRVDIEDVEEAALCIFCQGWYCTGCIDYHETQCTAVVMDEEG